MAKIKMKTKRAAAKRYKLTGKGRVKVGRKGKSHLFTGKSRKVSVSYTHLTLPTTPYV